jgi:hypothetical protein
MKKILPLISILILTACSERQKAYLYTVEECISNKYTKSFCRCIANGYLNELSAYEIGLIATRQKEPRPIGFHWVHSPHCDDTTILIPARFILEQRFLNWLRIASNWRELL